jgi:hypothetical protein
MTLPPDATWRATAMKSSISLTLSFNKYATPAVCPSSRSAAADDSTY